MEAPITPIQEVHPTRRNWTSKVEVMEKTYPRTSQSSRLYQKLIIGDSEGTRVEATIFGADIEQFQDTLKECKKYYISNALVRANLYAHKAVGNKYHWVINGATLVEEVADAKEEKITKFSFIPLGELSRFTDASSTIDILAAVIRVYPAKQITTRYGDTTIQELLLVTDELTTTKLTAWEQFIGNECTAISNIIESWPVIVGLRLKVSTFSGGLSLSTRSSSCLMINPDMPATSLRTWCIEHKDEVNMLLINKADQMPRGRTTGPTSENIFTTSTMGDVQPAENFWLKATASITNFSQKFWYTGCSKCFKAIHIECGKVYKCNHCKEELVTATPRPRFDVQLDDAYGHIIANCFGLNAKRLFDLTATTLKEHTDEDGITNKEFLEKVSKAKRQVFLLKPYDWKGQPWFTILSSKDEEAESSTTSAPVA